MLLLRPSAEYVRDADVDLDGNATGRRVSPLRGLVRLRGKPDDLAVAFGDD
jgi:hypothetical protein